MHFCLLIRVLFLLARSRVVASPWLGAGPPLRTRPRQARAGCIPRARTRLGRFCAHYRQSESKIAHLYRIGKQQSVVGHVARTMSKKSRDTLFALLATTEKPRIVKNRKQWENPQILKGARITTKHTCDRIIRLKTDTYCIWLLVFGVVTSDAAFDEIEGLELSFVKPAVTPPESVRVLFEEDELRQVDSEISTTVIFCLRYTDLAQSPFLLRPV